MQLYIFKINTCISAVMIHVPTIHVFACPHILGKLAPAPFHWLGAYRTNALYSGHIFVRFNDLEDVFT